ncbi:MAG: UvrD-helicase domain-containing protein [Candidatus Andersenbacteria bacterium]|nr:UvrD-helicase domain-containing protein [Candidatus Andersenbacteria bacterium]
MADFLADLNESQRQVALAVHGPVLVLAGAGSGKTRALTYRIAHLLREGVASPDDILAVTFTNKAAAEMRARVASLVGDPKKTPAALSTFHSLGVKVLREQAAWHNRGVGFSITDSKDSERLMKESLDRVGASRKEFPMQLLQHAISQAKNNRLSPVIMETQSNSPRSRVIAAVYAEYEKLLARHLAFDFDDLLLTSVELLEREAGVRAAYQARWRWLSVDEYQDTNPLQDTLLRFLTGPEKNLCVVGDDYQAIYSWRGARVDHILKFEKTFPGCQTIYLTQNYRSTPHILTAANAVIAQNKEQKHKKLWTDKTGGTPVSVWSLPSERGESRFVRQQIEAHVNSGGSLGDCVVLYRTNAQSRVFEEEFLTHRLPYTIIGGFKFYDRKEVKDALALLTLSLNPNSLLAFRRVAEALMPGVGDKTISKWAQTAEETNQPLVDIALAGSTKAHVQRVLVATRELTVEKFPTVSDMLQHLLTATYYLRELQKLPDGEERRENITELLNVAGAYEDPVKFLEDVALLSDLDTLEERPDRITCMTLHAAKGLEFPMVWLVGCEEGLLPHVNSIADEADLEEERRLLYVGMTRAKKQLFLSYVATRYMRGQTTPQAPSRFLQDLPEGVEWQLWDQSQQQGAVWRDPLYQEPTINVEGLARPAFDLKPQMMVMHPVLGAGVVISYVNNEAMCLFEGHGLKTVKANVLTVA